MPATYFHSSRRHEYHRDRLNCGIEDKSSADWEAEARKVESH